MYAGKTLFAQLIFCAVSSFFFLEVFEPDRRRVLPSTGISSARTPVCAATQATKQRPNGSGSSVARMSPRWSCAGVPSSKGRKRLRKASLCRPNLAMSVIVSAPATTASRHNSKISSSGYLTLPLSALPNVRQISEITQEDDCFAQSAPISTTEVSTAILRLANQWNSTILEPHPIVQTFSPDRPGAISRPACRLRNSITWVSANRSGVRPSPTPTKRATGEFTRTWRSD